MARSVSLPGAKLLNAIRGRLKSVLLLTVLPRYNKSRLSAPAGAEYFDLLVISEQCWRREARSENL